MANTTSRIDSNLDANEGRLILSKGRLGDNGVRRSLLCRKSRGFLVYLRLFMSRKALVLSNNGYLIYSYGNKMVQKLSWMSESFERILA